MHENIFERFCGKSTIMIPVQINKVQWFGNIRRQLEIIAILPDTLRRNRNNVRLKNCQLYEKPA